MKQRVWLDRNYHGDTVEITVRDASRAKLGSWVIPVNDKKRAKQVLKALKATYGILPSRRWIPFPIRGVSWGFLPSPCGNR